MSPAPIDFYFDFSSPYGHVAAFVIDDIAARHGRTVTWRPFLLGATFKITGMQPLLGIPMKREYARRDLVRSAGFLGVAFAGLPDSFPFSAVAGSRAFYWLADQDVDTAKALARALYRAAFVDRRDIAGATAVAEIAAGLGHDRETVLTALQNPAVKTRLHGEVDAAIAAGAFGSPFFVVDGEPFWGCDRLPQVEKWLATGGW